MCRACEEVYKRLAINKAVLGCRLFPYGKHKLRWLVEGSSLPVGERASSLEGAWGGGQGLCPQHPGVLCQPGHRAWTPALLDLPVQLSRARGRGSHRFSPSLVPPEAVGGGLLHASLAQGCCFNLRREEAPRPEEGGEGVHGGRAYGVMEDLAVKPLVPRGFRAPLGPARKQVPTPDTLLSQPKLARAETFCWGWSADSTIPVPSLGWGAGRGPG